MGGLYQTRVAGEELINLFGAGNINRRLPAITNSTRVSFSRDIDLGNVLRDNFGVDIDLTCIGTPYQYDVWIFGVIQNVAGLVLGSIPMAGPLCSIAFTIGMSAITDAEAFKMENISKLSPGTLLAVCESAAAMKGNIPQGLSFTKFVK